MLALKAYKCDLCLKFCDDIHGVNLPPVIIDDQIIRSVWDLCPACFDKLKDWVADMADDPYDIAPVGESG